MKWVTESDKTKDEKRDVERKVGRKNVKTLLREN